MQQIGRILLQCHLPWPSVYAILSPAIAPYKLLVMFHKLAQRGCAVVGAVTQFKATCRNHGGSPAEHPRGHLDLVAHLFLISLALS